MDERSKFLDQLQRKIEELHAVAANDQFFSMSILLNQLICSYADSETVTKIIAGLDHEIVKRKSSN
jgi:hypothetical protein